MFVVDTNVLVYASDEDSPFHVECLAKLERWRKQAGAWYVTWGIVYEFLRVTTHPKVMRAPWNVRQAWRFIEALLVSPGLSILTATERHPEVAARVFQENAYLQGNLLHDAHTAVLMLEHGVNRIYTRDTGFHRFPFLKPVDPLSDNT